MGRTKEEATREGSATLTRDRTRSVPRMNLLPGLGGRAEGEREVAWVGGVAARIERMKREGKVVFRTVYSVGGKDCKMQSSDGGGTKREWRRVWRVMLVAVR